MLTGIFFHQPWKVLLSVFLALLVSVPQVFAAPKDLEVYVLNRPFSGKKMVGNGKVYLEVTSLVPMLKLSLTKKGSTFIIQTSPKGASPDTPPQASSTVFINEKPFTDVARLKSGEILVSAEIFAKETGFNFSLNRQTGIVDITSAKRQLPREAPATPSRSSGGVSPGGGAEQQSQTPPISISGSKFFASTGFLRYRATVMNTGSVPVENVVVTCNFTYGMARTPWVRDTQTIGHLSPGEQKEAQFFSLLPADQSVMSVTGNITGNFPIRINDIMTVQSSDIYPVFDVEAKGYSPQRMEPGSVFF